MSTRPVIAAVARSPWALEMDVAGTSLATLLPRQLAFALNGTGAPSQRRLVPQTRAAAALLESPAGPRVERLVRGALSTLDARDGVGRLDGITLATDEQSLVLAQTMTQLQYHSDHPDTHGIPMPLPSPRTPDQSRYHYQQLLDGNLDYIRGKGELGIADCETRDWVDLGVPQSQALLAAAGVGSTPTLGGVDWSSRLPHDLGRELEHVVTAPITTADDYPPLAWLEQGMAETLASWPGAAGRMATAMGLPLPNPAGVAYPNTTDDVAATSAVRRLLALAGVDLSAAGAAPRAAALLQAPAFRNVPGTLADAILDANPDAAIARPELEQLIVASGGRDADLTRIEQLVRS